MKKLLPILILIFTLQTPSWADDILDFQIEEMSIGDSLLKYIDEAEIVKRMKTDYPNSNNSEEFLKNFQIQFMTQSNFISKLMIQSTLFILFRE